MAVISFHNVSKSFPRHRGQMLLRDRLTNLLRPGPAERFYALTDVSFSVEPGECIAIVGRNGAGKSTLLNIATGLCIPSSGAIEVNGRVAALLDLGSGFHPDLTGAENVRINGALLGLSRRQFNVAFERIVEFSGVGDFIDEPLRTYSSGMVMRLAFSIAINVDPDILIIDEVLGVGDSNFMVKCIDKIMEFKHAGKTLVCVSHSVETLMSLCNRGLWLDHGRLQKTGPIGQVLEAYQQMVASPLSTAAIL